MRRILVALLRGGHLQHSNEEHTTLSKLTQKIPTNYSTVMWHFAGGAGRYRPIDSLITCLSLALSNLNA